MKSKYKHKYFNFIRKQSILTLFMKQKLVQSNLFLNNAYKIIQKLNIKYIQIKLNNVIWSFSPPKLFHHPSRKDLFYVVVGRTSKISMLSDNGEIAVKVNNNLQRNIMCFSLAFSENSIVENRALKKFSEFLVKVKIIEQTKDNEINYSFTIPIDQIKHGTHYHEIGKNWLNFNIDIPPTLTKNFILKIKITFTNSRSLAIRKTTLKKSQNSKSNPEFFISEPKLLNLNSNNTKKDLVFYLSMESLTDPYILLSNDQVKDLMPNYSKLCEDSLVYSKAYASGDSTMCAMGTFSSGLRPGQHQFGNTKLDPTEHQIDRSFKSFPVLLKDLGFHTVGLTTYPRLSHRYGWHDGFDHYFNSEKPFFDDAVCVDNITTYLDNCYEDKVFMFVHLTRLHLPLFSNDDKQSPFYANIKFLDEAQNNKNFRNLYISAYLALDNEIGKLLSYLKHKNLYKNSTIILVGDHGVKMPPLWKNQILDGYDLYDQHVRVPLIIKPPNSYKSNLTNSKISTPINSHYGALRYLQSVYPDLKFDDFIQAVIDQQICMCETIYYPNFNNYAVCLVDDYFKYWSLFNIDWENYNNHQILSEGLFKASKMTYNEEHDFSKTLEREVLKRREYISQYIEKNIEIRKFYNNKPEILNA